MFKSTGNSGIFATVIGNELHLSNASADGQPAFENSIVQIALLINWYQMF
jgi:hypothetical protein